MANWRYTLDIKDIWESDNSVKDKGIAVASKIREVFPSPWFDYECEEYYEELADIAVQFEIIGDDDSSDGEDAEEFDWAMRPLYDWADQEVAPLGQRPANKMCWIKTF